MTYIVGLFGTHGTGKSTVLKGARWAGVNIQDVSLSRAAQAALGWTELSEAEKSVENMWALQDAILAAMYDRDTEINKSQILTLVERTPADMWAYTEMWCKRLGIDFVNDRRAISYKNQCRVLASNYRLFIQVPMTEEVAFVAEPNRADLASRVDAEIAMQEFVLSGGLTMYRLGTTGKNNRVNEAVMAIVQANNYND
jgi:hypothetical protein